MSTIISSIIPIIFIFILGYILKKIRLFTEQDSHLFLKLVFNVSLPALIINSIIDFKISLQFIFLPVIACIVVFTIYIISYIVGRFLHYPKSTLGILLCAIFNVQGVVKSIVLIGAAAPAGYNTLTFSSIEKLDTQFAAGLVSCSILFGIIFIPLLIYWLGVS